ncbi:hypothetical protein AU467_34610 [Mesorhizobium loti]|uniref:Uncharacterized protein n=1 Tax=Rhizobium loti TaxID=381 RepID=A0A101KX17_RHILI|nr:hypothetical protein AU467_34610 [Mesorhizobium loti]
MNRRDISLERQILAAFKLAHDTGRLAVADHLLCALECLCGDACRGTALGEAYRAICSCRPDQPARGER